MGPMSRERSRNLLIFEWSFSLLAIWGVFRLLLYVGERQAVSLSFFDSFATGLRQDFFGVLLFALPALLCNLLFSRLKKPGRAERLFKAVLLAQTSLFFFFTAGEILFWQEFHARFNFIAVDYLLYTGELVRNTWESYPIVAMLGVILALSYGLVWALWRRHTRRESLTLSPRLRWAQAGLAALVPILALALPINLTDSESSRPYVDKEIGRGGLVSLLHAFYMNVLEYKQFYVVAEDAATRAFLEKTYGTASAASPQKHPLLRAVSADPKYAGKTPNVMLVVMESMSARFLETFGNRDRLTPNLDRLSGEGLSFSNMFSTGTRTVRGLEAITLSVPPTPGQAIVRRADSDGLYNIGSVVRAQGYKTSFVYGGYSAFDNMKSFYEENGFEVVDRASLSDADITFSNAWGVCDEDLFKMATREADKSAAAEKPFFQIVMTSSNHRPYTYPASRIDIPSGTGREGAVKYSDYAIGEFLRQARAKPWFDNTLFVFVADHNASVAGRTDLPPGDFRIPFIVYQPKLVTPLRISQLASQIDVGPTVLGLLGFDYVSPFFGIDQRRGVMPRAFIATFEKLGYVEGKKLVVLSPGKRVENFVINEKDEPIVTPADKGLSDRAVYYYQGASDLFSKKLMKDPAAKPIVDRTVEPTGTSRKNLPASHHHT